MKSAKLILRPKIKAVCGISAGVVFLCWFYAFNRPAAVDDGVENRRRLDELAAQSPPLGARSKTADCRVNGPLPDRECTPGSVFPNADKEKICVDGYTKTVRNVPVSLKKKIYKAYGITYPPAFGGYELDHLIPLSLGGNNDAANLFPEAAAPPPGFREKDVVENYLRREMCAGNISLDAAQGLIAADWVKVYESLTPEDITTLKKQFKSWSEI
ncbi:HNH endonuclease [Candidatus Parcubacteria bacterium]|nr:HNH endonuclease [Candidatus Parcubacteria bacterium]